MPTRFSCTCRAAAIVFAAVAGIAAHAADAYPSKPIRMVVAFAPGGPTDLLARVVAQGMSKELGQQVIVDNKAGAGGALGTREAAKAAADGYTILFAGDAALTVQPQLMKNAGYEGNKDFTPIRLVASQRNVLVANKAKGLADLKTFIDKARAKPDSISFGSAGNGSPSHLIGALFESQVGLDLLHIPYRGAGPAMTDLIGGQVDSMFVGMPVAVQNAARPELVLLAVTGDKRSDALPKVPTFSELGVKGLGAQTAIWWAIMGPAGLDAQVRTRLDKAVGAALSDPSVRKNLEGQGVDVLSESAGTVTQWLNRDSAKWGKLIREKNITE